jgi:2-polyprenyl-3-methyl-5-hydroxy-6-metoxy-1,4-benzoquinol methylase
METIRLKWNERYGSVHVPNQVIDVLEINQHLLPKEGRSLDLACGLGGNALRMAELGFESHAWDISDAAIQKVNEFASERQLNLFSKQCDINQQYQQVEMLEKGFDVIIVSRFLLREIMPTIISALRPEGLIFYQTFIEEEPLRATGALATGPQNNYFRLQCNELLNLFSALTIRYYREDGSLGNIDKGLRNEALLVAQKKS